ncbi:hypothetical protein F5884DRAFT_767482 [Xylogone sp. PMI_703]|nr:hypothetical protein F5884DRAFT_767482 [Xylogone sp. PMI_703]
MSLFPNPRRIVTGHNAKGEAIVLKDSTIPCVPTPYGANFAVLWQTTQFPVSNDGDDDPIDVRTTDLSNKNGIILRVVDIPAHTEVKDMLFHRTESLDFGILFEGEVTCHLDNGVQVHMKPGDLCVQRGTIHGWTTGDRPCRIYFVLVAANPVTINGKVHGSEGYDKSKVESGGAS